MNLIVADTLKHAQAMLDWMKLPAETWMGATYGCEIAEKFDQAIIVRPINGVSSDHYAWITGILMPMVRSVLKPIPSSWRMDCHKEPELLMIEHLEDNHA